MKIETNKSLDQLNTFGIKAKAAEFISIESKAAAAVFFNENDLERKKFLILGGGSNLLLTKDVEGIVIQNNIKGIITVEEDDHHIVLEVGAGENWHQFVLYCVENNYAGLENLSLIPGNVGASPMQNIGAYGVEVKELITKVLALEIETGNLVEFNNSECDFDYRSSIFKTSHKGKYFITAVHFRLNKSPKFNIEYGAIKQQLEKDGVAENDLSIRAISDAVIAIRQSKLPDPKKIGNSGSFFKNPIITEEKFNQLKKRFKSMPAYKLPHGGYKLAAGWLIENAGWKGFREKDYGVHKNQALVLVNHGNATGEEIFNLSERILYSINKKFGVELEREVNVI
ncbi:MAG: UDP-N-acetylmuramate dehydrogenase [Vicingaceae bacterium]